MRTAILCLALALVPACATAQTQTQQDRPRKILTPEQIAYQQQMKTFYAEMDRLRTAAKSAYTSEIAREKAGECPNAITTVDINQCLSHEDEVTEANYKAFTSVLRAMLALPVPTMPGASGMPAIGPSGPEATPATNAAAFDAAESAWHTYAAAECGAIDTLWRGGTIVNSMVGQCNQRLARTRLHELDTAYDMLLHH